MVGSSSRRSRRGTSRPATHWPRQHIYTCRLTVPPLYEFLLFQCPHWNSKRGVKRQARGGRPSLAAKPCKSLQRWPEILVKSFDELPDLSDQTERGYGRACECAYKVRRRRHAGLRREVRSPRLSLQDFARGLSLSPRPLPCSKPVLRESTPRAFAPTVRRVLPD